MKKRLLSLLLACSMLASVGSAAFTASANTVGVEESGAVLQTEQSGETGVFGDYYDDYYYKVLDDGTVEITYYMGSEEIENIEIPSEIEGKKVTSVGERAFYHRTLKSVTIPNSVISIGDEAFEDCLNLKNVIIPNSVTSIGNSAFYYCVNLENVTIPNSVTNIGGKAFYGTLWLKKLSK